MSAKSLESLRAVAGNVSRETLNLLTDIDALLHRWNPSVNLVAPSTLPQSWERHILDSAQLWPLLDGVTTISDLGSGGGFPGLVLAALLKEREDGRITLVESNRKKTSFLQTVSGTMQLPAKIVPERIEIAVKKHPAPQVVTARALASLDVLLELAEPWFSAGSKALFHKGRDYRREIEESSAKWRFDLIEHPSKIDAEGVILELWNIGRA